LASTFEFDGRRYWVCSVGIDGGLGKTLSPTERVTAWYVAQSLSNEEVARERGVARRTVANQVASILRKLGVGSRVEIARALFEGPRASEKR